MDGVGIPPNIAAAIQRSQDARKELRARRRRTIAIIAGLCAAAGLPLSLSFADFSANDMVHAAAKAQSLADMLDQRSPGERTAAKLTKTMRKQIVLAKLRPLPRKPAVPPLASPLTPMDVELASIVIGSPALVPPLGQLELGPPPTPGTIVSPPGGGSVIAPPGGSTPPDKGTPPGNPTPPVLAPPVPEPGTWMTMLLGFGLIGWRIRRGKAAARKLRAACDFIAKC